MAQAKKPSLMERLGGTPALEAAVDEFYFRIMCDEDLVGFFDGVDMKLMKVHQRQFMTIAFTEIPSGFDVAGHLVESHYRLFKKGLNEKHFDKVATHLVEALFALGISKPLVKEVVGIVSPLRIVFEEAANEQRQKSKAKPAVAKGVDQAVAVAVSVSHCQNDSKFFL